MSVQDRLDGLRTHFQGCQIVAFADVSTGMILAASTHQKVEQEQLDALCLSAKEQLCGKTARNLSQHLFDGNGAARAVMLTQSGALQCFLRSPGAEHEALCLVAAPAVPWKDVLEAGAALLSDLGEGV